MTKQSGGIDMTVIIVAVIAAFPPTIASVAAVLISLNTQAKVEQVHLATNSMKDALVAATRKESLQEGREQGAVEEKARAKEAKK